MCLQKTTGVQLLGCALGWVWSVTGSVSEGVGGPATSLRLHPTPIHEISPVCTATVYGALGLERKRSL